MTQSEFDAELLSGKRMWVGTHVPSDLDISGREIHGDVNLDEMVIDGDLDLSDTVIHGSLSLFLVCVKGNLEMSRLKIEGELYSVDDADDKDLLHRYGLIGVEGEILSDDLEINGQSISLPQQYIHVPLEDRK